MRRYYTPQSHREETCRRSAERALAKMRAEEAADPEGYAERIRLLNEKARSFAARARGR